MSDITIYHNPACGTSRSVLGLIRDSGSTPTVVEYLKHPPDRATLLKLIADMGLPVREVIRQKETLFLELGLGGATVSDEQRIDAMLAHPVLIDRPIVVTPRGTRLCRPAETVQALLG